MTAIQKSAKSSRSTKNLPVKKIHKLIHQTTKQLPEVMTLSDFNIPCRVRYHDDHGTRFTPVNWANRRFEAIFPTKLSNYSLSRKDILKRNVNLPSDQTEDIWWRIKEVFCSLLEIVDGKVVEIVGIRWHKGRYPFELLHPHSRRQYQHSITKSRRNGYEIENDRLPRRERRWLLKLFDHSQNLERPLIHNAQDLIWISNSEGRHIPIVDAVYCDTYEHCSHLTNDKTTIKQLMSARALAAAGKLRRPAADLKPIWESFLLHSCGILTAINEPIPTKVLECLSKHQLVVPTLSLTTVDSPTTISNLLTAEDTVTPDSEDTMQDQ